MVRLVLLAECMECGHQQPYEVHGNAACEACGSEWLEAHYDYVAFKREILRGLPGRPFNLWRYRDVLPIADPVGLGLLSAGRTPLVPAWRHSRNGRHDPLHIKDERRWAKSDDESW